VSASRRGLIARIPTSVLTRSFAAALAPAAYSFARAVQDPRAAQTEALHRIVAEIGRSRRHAPLLAVRTLTQLQSTAPITTYDDYADDLRDAASGIANVLAQSRILRFERSGGSTAAQKLLPQSKPFLAEMDRALHPWLFDLYARVPGVAQGSAYWSISPMGAKAGKTAGGIPIGADDDAAYFPAPIRALLHKVLAVPSSLAQLSSVDECRYQTLLALLQRDELAMISVWSPTFLTLLLHTLRARRADLVSALRATHPERARLLEQTDDVAALWPRLALVSMWADGASAAFVDEARAQLPHVPLQPKGLLAVEGVVSIPWRGAHPLAVNSHVLEFVPVANGARAQRPRFAHEIEVGETYEVLLTTSAGLVRYNLGDRVLVTGAHAATPTVKFVGRGGVVSDLVGEKLAVDRVASVLAAELPRARFAMLAPSLQPRGYVLFLDAGDARDTSDDDSAARVERRLCEGHPYRHARELGQLAPVRVRRVHDALRWYETRCVVRGQRAGDVKPTPLHLATDWEETVPS
jgi:hypothetical protein